MQFLNSWFADWSWQDGIRYVLLPVAFGFCVGRIGSHFSNWWKEIIK